MSISKTVRFEVFKRDKFTCQYCGRRAPDVVLEVDHVKPRADGGGDSLINLTTSCEDCNRGKGKRPLSDDSIVVRQRAQLEELQERQEQLAMMVEWQRSLMNLDDQAVTQVASLWADLIEGFRLTETGRSKLKKWLRRYGVEAISEAMRIAVEQYLVYDDQGHPTQESLERAYNMVPGICRVNAASAKKPYLRDLYYIRGILRRRLSHVVDWQALQWMEAAISWGAVIERLREIAFDATSWTNWKLRIDSYIEELKAQEGSEAGDPDA